MKKSPHFTRFGLRDVDVESVVRSQNVIYENAAACWQDGHILGNGDLGVVAYAPYWLEWTINKVDVFDARMASMEKLTYQEAMAEVARRKTSNLRFLDKIEKQDPSYDGPTEPLLKSCGQVKLRAAGNEYSWGAPPPYQIRQELSLWEATNTMDLRLPASSPTVSSFVNRASNLLVIRMKGATGPMWSKRLELCRPYEADYASAQFGHNREKTCLWFLQKMPDGSAYAMAMGVTSTGGVLRHDDSNTKRKVTEPGRIVGIHQKGDRAWFVVDGDLDLFVAVATSRESKNPLVMAQQIVSDGMRKGHRTLKHGHAKWWADFWKKSFVQHEDALVEQLWYLGVYQAGSALGRAPVPGLFGLWHGYDDLPNQGFFWAVYTLNQNVQMASMPVFAINHPELGQPFMDTFLNALPRTIEDTRQQFGRPGVCFPQEMAFLGGEPHCGGACRFSCNGGPFCGILYVWAYRHTLDRKLLRETVYPFLREVVRFHTAFMEKGADGRYHLPLTVPAEIATLAQDAIIDISLLKPCLKLTVEASRLFGVDVEERRKWEEVLAHYPDYPLQNGIIVDGKDIPLNHWSNDTYRLYPLILGHDARPEVRRLVRKTLEHITPRFRTKDGKAWHVSGWAWLFYSLAKLYLGDRKDLMPLLYEPIRRQLKPNGLFAHLKIGREQSEHPHYRELVAATPENNSAFTMLLTEMLMQSHNGLIRLFPGIHGKQTARFGDLRAQGAFLVSAEMIRGRVKFVRVRADRGGMVRIVNPWRGKAVRVFQDGKRPRMTAGEILAFQLRKKESLYLTCGRHPRVMRVGAWHQAGVKAMRFPDGMVVTVGKSD